MIAFGARKLNPDEEGAKYLNTPETPLFHKSSVLYGADLAKRDIAQRRQAVIVEGYTDVMACHLAGVPTAVATCGTSFGEDHVKILRRLLMDADWQVAEVIFTFDGDAAGQKAALRAFGLEERFATQTYVAVQPDGLDPCDLRIKQGDAAVRDLVARRQPVYEFVIRSEIAKHNLETNEGRLAALDAAAPIIGRIKDKGLRTRYAGSVDHWLGLMNEEFVMARVREHAGGVESASRPSRGRQAGGAEERGTQMGGPGGRGSAGGDRRDGSRTQVGGAVPQPREGYRYDTADPLVRLERQVLKLAVQRPALCGPAFDALTGEAFTVPVHRSVRDLIVGCGGVASAGPAREWAARILEAAPTDRAREFITALAVETIEVPRKDGEPDARYAEEVLAGLEALEVGRQIFELKSRLQRLNPAENPDYNRAFGDLVALEQRRKALLDRAGGAI